MNDDQFNRDLRAFLKRFGVTAQREIERVVHHGIEAGTLTGDETLTARATLELDGVTLQLVIEEPIRLA